VIQKAQKMIETIAQIPWARKIELPEAICLAAGKIYDHTVLTENRGALNGERNIARISFCEDL